jgi:hypothetical protein
MTKLMMWNIQFFTDNKIADQSGNDFVAMLNSAFRSFLNKEYIVSTARNADIFVVIEVQSSRGELGTLIGGGGALGVLLLLQHLRAENPNWCLVPPPRLVGLTETGERSNYTEGIAVFFRSDKLAFGGPYCWPKADRKGGFEKRAVCPPPDGDPRPIWGPYPDPWANALPPNNYFAAQYEYFPNTEEYSNELLFLDSNKRRPLCTRFLERGGDERVITIVSTHPSPTVDTKQAVMRLMDIREVGPTGRPRVVVLGGDINIDVFDESNNAVFWAFDLYDVRYKQQFGPDQGGTLILPARSTGVNGTPTTYRRRLGLDNMFTRYDQLEPPASSNALVIDRVTGVAGYSRSMIETIAHITTNYPLDVNGRFQLAMNYGHIAHVPGVSDHLPIVIDL